MALLTFEDIEPGLSVRSEPVTLTRESIVAFARTYDPQPFHLDEQAGRESLLGGLAASGWQTSALGMRLLYDGLLCRVASMGSPGVDEVRWPRPVRPGDTLTLEATATGKRGSASRPDRGFVTFALEMKNAANETVMTQRSPVIVQRRDMASAPPARSGLPPAEGPGSLPPLPPADMLLTAFFDELSIGLSSTFGTQRFTADLITSFATLYDPQYFHLDEEAARTSQFGGLIASGWQTAAFWMKHYIAARQRSGAARAEAGLPAAVGGPSPGLVNMRWLRPVYAGESVTYGLKITGLRRAGRSNWGIVLTENTGHAADGTLVFVFDGRLLWPLTAA